jgi:predicted nucleic acid-binding protein
MEAVLIDTSVIIGRMRKQAAAFDAFERIEGATPVLCDMVVAEVLHGARSKAEHERLWAELHGAFHVLPFTMEVSQLFRAMSRNYDLMRDGRFGDVLIAATALAHGCSLLTLNKKDFDRIKGLKLL